MAVLGRSKALSVALPFLNDEEHSRHNVAMRAGALLFTTHSLSMARAMELQRELTSKRYDIVDALALYVGDITQRSDITACIVAASITDDHECTPNIHAELPERSISSSSEIGMTWFSSTFLPDKKGRRVAQNMSKWIRILGQSFADPFCFRFLHISRTKGFRTNTLHGLDGESVAQTLTTAYQSDDPFTWDTDEQALFPPQQHHRSFFCLASWGDAKTWHEFHNRTLVEIVESFALQQLTLNMIGKTIIAQ